MKKLIILIFCVSCAFSAFSQGIEGAWHGSLELGPVKLPLVLHVDKKDSGYSATMDSPNQGAKGIPVTSVLFENNKLSFTIINLGVEYEGVLQGDSVAGTFRQNGMELPLTLAKVKETAASSWVEPSRPQTPQPPYPYNVEEVRFENNEAGITLAGTLTWPDEGAGFAAAVLITGSGAQNRDEEVLGHRPFWVLSDFLTRNGIAVLRYDDRGVFESGGDYETANLDDFAADALSAVNYLKTRKEINPQKIGAVGHSEGGTIAFILGGEQKNDLAFIVSMAGMAIPGDSLLRLQRYALGKASGASDEQIAQREVFIDLVNTTIKNYSPEFVRQNIESVTDEALPDSIRGIEGRRRGFQQALMQMTSPEFQSLTNCNPAAVLTQINCPVLAVNGEKDLQVHGERNLTRVKELVKSPVTTKLYPDLNHLFQHCATGHVNEYASIEETLSFEVLDDIAAWITQATR